MNTMRLSPYFNCGTLLLAALWISACQPPPSNDHQQLSKNNEQASSPITIDTDSVTMSSDYILNIKPSRYQPSLGLQGTIEPHQQSRFVTTRHILVQKILIKEGQWVENGAPLLLLQPKVGSNKAPLEKANTNNVNNSDAVTEAEPKGNDTTKNNSATETSVGSRVADDNIVDDNKPTNAKDTTNSQQLMQPIVVYASFSGRVDTLYVEANEEVAAGQPLLLLSNDKDLRFIATLPIQAEPQLSVGQTVNFMTKDVSETFTGQVSELSTSQQLGKLTVYVSAVKNDASRDKLKVGMQVMGRVDYGQIAVGNIVPEQAIHDVDLSSLKTSPYQPLTPLTANVWIIKQNQRLTRQPIEVIKYEPSTGKYLIAGISNDSLICLADLPIESVGKKVVIS